MHSDYTMLMSVVLDDAAAPDELQRLHEHVRTCAACAGIWERLQAVDRRFDAAPLVTPAPNFADTVMARIEARSLQRRQTRRYATGLVALTLAVSLLGLAVLGGLLYLGAQSPSQVSSVFFAALRGAGTATWIFLGVLRLMGGVGAPTLAAWVGLLATLTCLLSMLWLWVVGRGHAGMADSVTAG
jgi:predicted anti-sigma-YlaC factor YlaD